MRVECCPWCVAIVRQERRTARAGAEHHRPNHRMMISDGMPRNAVDQESRP
jgi:hypothetical protein